MCSFENHTDMPHANADTKRMTRLTQFIEQRESTRKRLTHAIWMCKRYRKQIRSLRQNLAWLNGNLAEIDDLLELPDFILNLPIDPTLADVKHPQINELTSATLERDKKYQNCSESLT